MVGLRSITVFSSLFALSAAQFEWTVGVGIDETVGQPGQGFDPSRVVTQAGDTVTFEWSRAAEDHTVVQVDPRAPCVSNGGYSFQPGPDQSITLNGTDPVYFASLFGEDCQAGMIFCANCPAEGEGSVHELQDIATQASATVPVTSASSSSSSASADSSETEDSSDDSSSEDQESDDQDGSAAKLELFSFASVTAVSAGIWTIFA